jgi:hypothetical protein
MMAVGYPAHRLGILPLRQATHVAVRGIRDAVSQFRVMSPYDTGNIGGPPDKL